MTPEQAEKLRAPFRPEQIGKLPKPTKKDNPKGRCNECGGYHGLPAVHLDYVGHAAATDRLLQVDPEWSWEPMAIGPNGEPLIVNGGLWIKLTVAGVTKPGFGDEGNGKGMKEMIGDAIRNAAMRFGVALDLWAKEDLHGDGEASANGSEGAAVPASSTQSEASAEGNGAEPTPSGNAGDIEVTFGKHRGKRLRAVLDVDRNYVEWLAGTFEAKTSDAAAVKAAAQVVLAGGGDFATAEPLSEGTYVDDSIPFAASWA